MFALDAQSRRWMCRVGFVAFCLVPTLTLASWGIARHLPGHALAYERHLSALLDVAVSIEAVTHPRPGVDIYTGLELRDPETERLLAQVARLEVARSDEKYVLLATEPELQADAVPHLWRLLLRSLRRDGAQAASLRLVAPRATVHTAAQAHELADLSGGIHPAKSEAQAYLHFRMAGDTPGELATLRVTRRRDGAPATLVELHTGPSPLPCSFLLPGVDLADWLGPACRFRGSLWASHSEEGWETELTGQLAPLDLHQLLTTHFPHKLSGSGHLTLEGARFHGDRLFDASGTLVAGPGLVSRSLVESAVESLDLPGQIPPNVQAGMLAYEKLAFTFLLSSDGIVLRGACGGTPSGAILVDRTSVILAETKLAPPVTGLVNMLLPYGEPRVPTSHETERLLRRLPIPQVAASSAAPKRRGAARDEEEDR